MASPTYSVDIIVNNPQVVKSLEDYLSTLKIGSGALMSEPVMAAVEEKIDDNRLLRKLRSKAGELELSDYERTQLAKSFRTLQKITRFETKRDEAGNLATVFDENNKPVMQFYTIPEYLVANDNVTITATKKLVLEPGFIMRQAFATHIANALLSEDAFRLKKDPQNPDHSEKIPLLSEDEKWRLRYEIGKANEISQMFFVSGTTKTERDMIIASFGFDEKEVDHVMKAVVSPTFSAQRDLTQGQRDKIQRGADNAAPLAERTFFAFTEFYWRGREMPGASEALVPEKGAPIKSDAKPRSSAILPTSFTPKTGAYEPDNVLKSEDVEMLKKLHVPMEEGLLKLDLSKLPDLIAKKAEEQKHPGAKKSSTGIA